MMFWEKTVFLLSLKLEFYVTHPIYTIWNIYLFDWYSCSTGIKWSARIKKGLKILTPIWANSHMFGIHRIPWQITKTKKKWKLYIFLRIVKIKECKDVTNKLGVNGTTCNYCNRNFCKFYFTLMQGSSKQKFMKENIFDGCFIMKK